MVSAPWQQYQEEAAAVFERLGCSVAVDAKITGARSSHRVDVLVRFTRWGLKQTEPPRVFRRPPGVSQAAIA